MCITLAVSVSVPTKLKHMKDLKNYLGMNRYKDAQGFMMLIPLRVGEVMAFGSFVFKFYIYSF